jgi:hypothetical protein
MSVILPTLRPSEPADRNAIRVLIAYSSRPASLPLAVGPDAEYFRDVDNGRGFRFGRTLRQAATACAGPARCMSS